jgi:GNAT superfamily N-acetyltransferase
MTEASFRARPARPDEAQSLRSASREELTFLEGLFSPKPKNALAVETLDGCFAGSAFYTVKGQYGIVDIIYVLRQYKGTGAARLLYKSVIELLKAKGCTRIMALVIDDNAPSFKSFERNDMHTVTMTSLAKAWGFKGLVHLVLGTPALLACGCRIVANIESAEGKAAPLFWAAKIALCLMVSILVSFLSTGLLDSSILWSIPAAFASLSVMLAGQLAGNLISKRPFYVHQDSAGLLTSLLVSQSGALFPPMIHLYPKDWGNDDQTRRQLGLSAFFSQFFTMAAMVILFYCKDAHPMAYFMHRCLWLLCVYDALFFYPFSVFGTKAIWNYSKALCLIMEFMNLASIIRLH